MTSSDSPGRAVGGGIYLSVSPFAKEELGRAASIARSVGCSGVEMPAAMLDDARPPVDLGDLRVCLLAVSWRPDRPLDMTGAISVARDLGAWGVNVYGGLPSGADPLASRGEFVADVRAALVDAGEDGPVLLLENELARAPGFSAAFDAWLGILRAVDSPRFRGTLDAANFVAAGDAGAVERIMPEASAWIGHVHAKGVVPFDGELHRREPYRRVWEAEGRWLAAPAGEGLPDWRRLLHELIEGGYPGAVTVEPFREDEPIRSAVECIRQTMRSARGQT